MRPNRCPHCGGAIRYEAVVVPCDCDDDDDDDDDDDEGQGPLNLKFRVGD
jgi:hypothetical protein